MDYAQNGRPHMPNTSFASCSSQYVFAVDKQEVLKPCMMLLYRQHRDLSLLNLGCVVQQARCPAEAAIVLHAAVDHDPHMAASHFALANVYAILGDYNRYLTFCFH